MPDHETNLMRCWHCNSQLDGHMNVDPTDDSAPREGAVTGCIYCGAWGLFASEDGVLSIRKPTDDEWVEFMTSLTILREAYVLTRFREEKGIGVTEE